MRRKLLSVLSIVLLAATLCTPIRAQQTTVHNVILNWQAPTTAGSTPIVSYNIYRGTASGGPYVKIGAVPATTTTYTDAGVAPGAVLYYVVTAMNQTDESKYSNEARGDIPYPSGSPTGLSVTVTVTTPTN